MTLRMPLALSSYHFQTCDWGMETGVEEMVAPGLFYVDCSSGPLGDSGVIADGPNWHLWGCTFGGNLPDGQIWMVMGSTDSHMDTLGLLPLSSIWLQPRQSPTDPPESLRGLWLGRLVHQTMCTTPVSMNVASLYLPKLRPSLKEHLP